MKPWITTIGICFTLLSGCYKGGKQTNVILTSEETTGNKTEAPMIIPDLKAVPEGTVWNGSIHNANLVEKDGAAAVEFTKQDWNLVWLNGFEFTNGTIEFDAKGKSEPPQSSFIGVGFRVMDDGTYDAVYFRPFNFRASDADRKSHAIQYISSPHWPWDRLREEKPGQYEMPIEPGLPRDL